MSVKQEKTIEEKVLSLIEDLRQLVIIVEDFQSDSQNLVFEKINRIISDLQLLEQLKGDIDVDVPFDVLRYVDNGMNPDLYTKYCLQSSLQKNESTKGKIEALNALQNQLKTVFGQETKTILDQDIMSEN